jgi:hypothetical protein
MDDRVHGLPLLIPGSARPVTYTPIGYLRMWRGSPPRRAGPPRPPSEGRLPSCAHPGSPLPAPAGCWAACAALPGQAAGSSALAGPGLGGVGGAGRAVSDARRGVSRVRLLRRHPGDGDDGGGHAGAARAGHGQRRPPRCRAGTRGTRTGGGPARRPAAGGSSPGGPRHRRRRRAAVLGPAASRSPGSPLRRPGGRQGSLRGGRAGLPGRVLRPGGPPAGPAGPAGPAAAVVPGRVTDVTAAPAPAPR